MQGVYAIVNAVNGCRYIGSSKDIAGRWQDHSRGLSREQHHCAHLQRAWNKYGAVAFRFEIVELVLLREQLREREQRHLDSTPNKYNVSVSADHGPGMTGRRHTAETRERIKEARARQARRHCSEETKQRMSLAQKGRPSPHRGRHLSQEVRDKIRRTKTGKRVRQSLTLKQWNASPPNCAAARGQTSASC